MDLNKSKEFFDPAMLEQKKCHIIGCGAIGSSVAELLARAGVEDIVLWDEDIVESHNIANQMFTQKHLHMAKTTALSQIIKDINPECNVQEKDFYKEQNLAGYVFLCVDNIDLRREIATFNKYNTNIIMMFDFRMRLVDGQCYAAKWDDIKKQESFIDSMQFTHEEAVAQTPVSACGFTLSVASTVRVLTSLGVANFMNYVRKQEYKHLILADAFEAFVESY